MINYITGVFCLLVLLVALTYYSKQAGEKTIALEELYTTSGQTQMDVACSRVSRQNAGQAAVCVAYFNSKKVYKKE